MSQKIQYQDAKKKTEKSLPLRAFALIFFIWFWLLQVRDKNETNFPPYHKAYSSKSSFLRVIWKDFVGENDSNLEINGINGKFSED